MKWSIQEIHDYPEDLMPFAETIDITSQLKARNERILDAQPIEIEGYLMSEAHEVMMHATAKISLTLPSTRSLIPVDLDLTFQIKERYVMPSYEGDISEYEETTIILEDDFLDLVPILIDSVLVNLPHKVIGPEESDDQLPRGDHWEVITEEEYNRQQAKAKESAVDPRFAELQSLFNESDSKE